MFLSRLRRTPLVLLLLAGPLAAAASQSARTPLQISEDVKAYLGKFRKMAADKNPAHAAAQLRTIDEADLVYDEATALLLARGGDEVFFENYLRLAIYMMVNKQGEGTRVPLAQVQDKRREPFERAVRRLRASERKYIRDELKLYRETLVRGNG